MAHRRERKEKRIRHRTVRIARHRTEKTAPHSILATLVGASAGLMPFIVPNPGTGGNTVIDEMGGIITATEQGNYSEASYYSRLAGQDFVNGVVSQIPALIALGAVAGGIGWAGRKYARSSTNISRKWRVF